MMASGRPCLPTEVAGLAIQQTDDGSWTLLHVPTGVTFHSLCGAATETRQVYLENSGIGELLRGGRRVRVLEMGFGTGMAFVQTAGAAVQGGGGLDYVALENRLLPAAVIQQLQPNDWTPQTQIVDALLACRRHWPQQPAEGHYTALITPSIQLTVMVGDAERWQSTTPATFDAVYFDPFGPRDTPQLWQADLLQRMFAALCPGGRLVSYCVSGQVRRRLSDIGFHVQRVPGPPGGKREVLIATRPAAAAAATVPPGTVPAAPV